MIDRSDRGDIGLESRRGSIRPDDVFWGETSKFEELVR
jgi:hypothetical protein